jgi:hypothetical protein
MFLGCEVAASEELADQDRGLSKTHAWAREVEGDRVISKAHHLAV